jgi:hypothetical protein
MSAEADAAYVYKMRLLAEREGKIAIAASNVNEDRRLLRKEQEVWKDQLKSLEAREAAVGGAERAAAIVAEFEAREAAIAELWTDYEEKRAEFIAVCIEKFQKLKAIEKENQDERARLLEMERVLIANAKNANSMYQEIAKELPGSTMESE